MNVFQEKQKPWKRIAAGLLAFTMSCVLLMSPAAAFAAPLSVSETDTDGLPALDSGINTSAQAEIKSKSEIIYGMLGYDGALDTAYVVNRFSVTSEGSFKDYGTYSAVENLTNTEPLDMKGDEVDLAAAEGEFYYQGTMTSPVLPWQFSVSYTLDGEKIPASKIVSLGGQSGRLGIHIATGQNSAVDSSFYEHYTLQVGITLPTENISNLSAEGATVASAGSNTQVNYMVLPGSDESYDLEVDFEGINMPGISIAGVPFGMDFAIPDTSGMSSELSSLVSAIDQLTYGAYQLNTGAAQAASGLETLASGSALYNTGLTQLSAGSQGIRDSSYALSGGLAAALDGLKMTISNPELGLLPAQQNALNNYIDTYLSPISEGYAGLDAGLQQYTGGVDALASQYSGINNGISQSASGVRQLSNGVSQLSSGASQLSSGVQTMPQEMQSRIDEFASEYDYSGFEPHSYLSPKNGNVVLVQFVITTPAIELPEETEEAEDPSTESSIWDKFLNLFTGE